MPYLEKKDIRAAGSLIDPWPLSLLTFTVTPARSRSSTTVLANVLPSWLPRKRWKAISAALRWREDDPSDSDLLIQCAVIARYGCRFWSDHTSAVKDILPAAFCASGEKDQLWIYNNDQSYREVFLEDLEIQWPSLDNEFLQLCSMRNHSFLELVPKKQ